MREKGKESQGRGSAGKEQYIIRVKLLISCSVSSLSPHTYLLPFFVHQIRGKKKSEKSEGNEDFIV